MMDMQKWFNSLGFKFALFTITTLLLTLVAVSYFYLRAEYNDTVEHLLNQSELQAQFIAEISPEAILNYDFEALERYVEEMTEGEDIVYAVIMGANGQNMTSHLDWQNPLISSESDRIKTKDVIPVISAIEKMQDILSIRFPIISQNDTIGSIGVGISKVRIDKKFKKLARHFVSICVVLVTFLTIGIFIGFRRLVIDPIHKLEGGFAQVADGHLDGEVKISYNDEIGRLTHSFNSMVQRLQKTISEKEIARGDAEKQRLLRDQAVQASEAKSTFLANMSHELRTPLNAIIGYSEMLLEDTMDNGNSGYSDDLNKIHDAGSHLLTIISDILDLSKVEAGKIDLSETTFDLHQFVHDIACTVKPMVVSKHNTFDVRYEGKITTMKADITKLRQILLNILSNACKFTENGHISLILKSQQTTTVNNIVFEISDTGIGIKSEQVGLLFEPFVQADNSTTRKYGGTGLGLAISLKFIELMGGTINVTSELGKGAIFFITIPQEQINITANVA